MTDTIGGDYKKWEAGDVVLIESQTGTGKSQFIKNKLIPYLLDHERLLYVSNRTNLKRQTKKDILDNFGLSIPDTLDELDELTTINNITVSSYHGIVNSILDHTYHDKPKIDLNFFDYIILDEAHFLLSDSSFNPLTYLAYDLFVNNIHHHSVKIFITATMQEIKNPIITQINRLNNNGFNLDKCNIYEYSTGKDYSYLSVKYFHRIKTIGTLIKNDKSDDKWLVFVANKQKEGEELLKMLGEDMASFVKSGDKNDEISNIINNSQFSKKVLIATKVLDNGINIIDEKLRHIVIIAWDEITFLQELGRKRVDIKNAEEINLYIPKRYRKSFSSKLGRFKRKQKQIKLFENDKKSFHKKYDHNLGKYMGLDDIFYYDTHLNQIRINKTGRVRLMKDIAFFSYMVDKFDSEEEFAYLYEQLSWLGLEYTFSTDNLLDSVLDDEDNTKLIEHLDSIVDKKLYNDDQQKLSDLIIKELITLQSNIDYRTKKLKPSTLETIIRDQLKLPYAVSKPIQEGKGENRGKRYIIITKLKL